jgi:predicted carbohydrate-binding protein with CBM5 and CBM33 domain
MQFYNLKTRSHVDVPDDKVRKMKMTRKTKSGEQVRYALTAEHDGSKLFKFVNEETYNSSKAPEAK